MQYQVIKKKKKDLNCDLRAQLFFRMECLYHKLEDILGTQNMILQASKLDALDLMSSALLEDRVLALQKLLEKDPTITRLTDEEEILKMIDHLEDLVAETHMKRTVEEELHKRIQAKMDQKYNDYVRDIKLQILKEEKNSPENAQTLKKLGQLEKMERTSLNSSALEILRPTDIYQVVGQEKARRSLIASLNTPYPQHILLYGPPGVGKTTCARLALEMVRGMPGNSFPEEAPFIEVDGSTMRWDPRESTNPLLGSVHDPIYQGARKELADEGIPEPKLGLVSEAHGGILFIDEIGDMDILLQNKLLKVLEDKRVYFESSYYDPHDDRIPRYIKQIFEKGVPANFILIGATTRNREEISPAFRSRCREIFFDPLSQEQIIEIVRLSAGKLKMNMEAGVEEIIAGYSSDGRSANKILLDAYSLALNEGEASEMPLWVNCEHVYEAIQNNRIHPAVSTKASDKAETGKIFGLGASGYRGTLIEIEAIAFPAEKSGEGAIRFNDTAGSMARDSVFNAASLIRMENGEKLNNYDLHINFVGGGNVDGPSAGAAIYLAILSAIKKMPVRQDVAITGEVSIQGRIKAVGALYEKIYGAMQAKIKKVLIPESNAKDIPSGIKGIEIIPIRDIKDSYEHIFKRVE